MPPEQFAPPIAEESRQYEFGPFRLDAERRSLYRGEEFIPLTPKAAEMLVLLVEEAGHVVSKERILDRVWPGVVVEEGAIANNISSLRKVLGTDFGTDGPIATVARRGYRFTAEVHGASAPSPAQSRLIPTRDTILIADIENMTGDPVFDGTIRQALLLHLAQSPFLEVVTERKAHELLGFMGKQGAAVIGEVALELCQRTGSKAAITGSIFAIGDDYVIGLQALHSDTGDILLTEQARAHGKNEVLRALDQAALGLRTKLGESLASVESYFRPFDDVATSSLEALKAYTTGRTQWFEQGEAAAKPHQLRAIELDPHFVSAYSALAIACGNMGQTLEARRYMQKAYDLRERATERERIRIATSYHDLVTGDIFKALDAHRTWQASGYADAVAYGNAGAIQMIAGQWDKALSSGLQSQGMENTVISASNVALAQLALGLHADARATLQDAFDRGWYAFYLHLDAYQEAFLRGDTEAMRRHVDAVAGRDTEEDFMIAAQADTDAYFGRFGRARELSRRAVESARKAGAVEMAASWEAEAALREALVGNFELARAGAAAALEISLGKYVEAIAGVVFALSGDARRAREIAAALDQDNPQHTIVQRNWLACIRAALAISTKDWKAAIDALETATAVELGITLPFEGGFMIAPYLRGVALLGAGRGDDAAREFRKIVERPGLIRNFVIFPLAHLRGAEALALAGRGVEADALRKRFEETWKSADIDLHKS